MENLTEFKLGCRFRYHGRTLVVRATTHSIVVAVPAQVPGEPTTHDDCVCIARTELQWSDVVNE